MQSSKWTLITAVVIVAMIKGNVSFAQVTLDPSWPENPRTFGGERRDYAWSVRQTADGGYIVAGYTESFGAGRFDVYVVKLDSRGDLDPVWDPNPKTFGGERDDYAWSVQETSNGGYIVAGSTSSFGAVGHEN